MLRNVSSTAPSIHNSLFETLRAALDYYDEPDRWTSGSVNRDAGLDQALRVTEPDRELLAILESPTDDRFRASATLR